MNAPPTGPEEPVFAAEGKLRSRSFIAWEKSDDIGVEHAVRAAFGPVFNSPHVAIARPDLLRIHFGPRHFHLRAGEERVDLS